MKKGTVWMALGMLLLVAALGLTAYNIWDENKAEKASTETLEELVETIVNNVEENTGEEIEPIYKSHPDVEIPAVELNGNYYMGLLEIPALNLALPVMKDWSYPKLKISPCRFVGSVYTDDIIIMAHNYNSHFGGLKTLNPGDTVKFTDIDGNLFTYKVATTEIIGGAAVEDMVSGEWDMTLFTCTYGGRTRVTVRLMKEQ